MKKSLLILLMSTAGYIAKAQIPQPDPDTTARHFLIVASIGNLQEVSAGQLAAQKGMRAQVKSFGQMMVKDHSMAEQQLLQLAQQRKIHIPAAASGGIKPDPMLANAGNKFDKLYVHAMVNAHRNTVQTFQNYAITGKDPEVKAWAQQKLPTLKMHLQHVEAIEKQLNSVGK